MSEQRLAIGPSHSSVNQSYTTMWTSTGTRPEWLIVTIDIHLSINYTLPCKQRLALSPFHTSINQSHSRVS